MRVSPLQQRHQARGARFREVDGTRVAVSFGDVAAEARALRARPTRVDRSARGRIEVRGADRVSFLHGQSTNDVKALRPGQGQRTSFLTGKGKLRGSGVLLALPDRLLLSVDPWGLERLHEHLGAFVILEDVELRDASGDSVEIGVYGPGSRGALEKALGAPIPEELADHHFVALSVDGGELLVAAERCFGVEGFRLLAERAAGAAAWDALEGLETAGHDALEVLRVEAGVALFGHDLDQDAIPVEAAFDDAISYTKGCFTGQEVLARIRNYGHTNRRLVGLLPAAGARPGEGVRAGGRPVGSVTSAVHSVALEAPIALAMLRREVASPGSQVELEAGPARVVELPFVAPAATGS